MAFSSIACRALAVLTLAGSVGCVSVNPKPAFADKAVQVAFLASP